MTAINIITLIFGVLIIFSPDIIKYLKKSFKNFHISKFIKLD